jgi:hypothetical protein
MGAASFTIRISGMNKQDVLALRAQAKAAHMSEEGYARQLMKEAISLELTARSTTFDELYAPTQARFVKSGMKEDELDRLVDSARARHRRRTSRKRT